MLPCPNRLKLHLKILPVLLPDRLKEHAGIKGMQRCHEHKAAHDQRRETFHQPRFPIFDHNRGKKISESSIRNPLMSEKYPNGL